VSRTHVVALTDAIAPDLPECCRDCVFWQARTVASDAARKRRWATHLEERHGAWGRVLFDGDTFLGRLQYAPAAAFPRARVLPSGPPRPDGALITCAYLAPEDADGTLERLLLEALADLKGRGYATVDAFAIASDGESPDAAHHTLLHGGTLARLGFTPVRTHGAVMLMRLELRGLDRAPEPQRSALVLHPEPAMPGG
jgi:hypothetical protein